MTVPIQIIERLHGIAYMHKLDELHKIADELKNARPAEPETKVTYQASVDGVNWTDVREYPQAASQFRYIRPRITAIPTSPSIVVTAPIHESIFTKKAKKKGKKK